MKVTNVAPFVGKVHDEMDRVFDRFLGNRYFADPQTPPFTFEPTGIEWMPMLDLTETEGEFVARIEVPGIPKENLDINLTGDLVTITGHRERLQEKKGEDYLWQERKTGKFCRAMRLPESIVPNKVEATYQDGVLAIHFPKVTPAPASKILIK